MKKIYKFSGSWCAECKSFSETLSTIESPYPIEEVDVDENPRLATKMRVRGVPLIMIVEGDVVIKKRLGEMTAEQFLEWVK